MYVASPWTRENTKIGINSIQSNLVIRNFLVALKLFLNAKCSSSLWSKLTIGHGKWFLNINLFLIKTFLISYHQVWLYIVFAKKFCRFEIQDWWNYLMNSICILKEILWPLLSNSLKFLLPFVIDFLWYLTRLVIEKIVRGINQTGIVWNFDYEV